MSFTFADAKGDVWDCEISMGGARRIDKADFSALRAEPFSFLKPPQELFTDIITDTGLLMAMLWCVVQPQAQERGLDEDEFCERLKGGDVLLNAKSAMWGAIADFFPEQRTALNAIINEYRRAQSKAAEEMMKALPAMQSAVDNVIGTETERLISQLKSGVESGI